MTDSPNVGFVKSQWRRFQSFWKTTVTPESYSEQGKSRMVIVDFLRGTSTFVMLLFHVCNNLVSLGPDFLGKLKWWDYILVAPVGLVSFVFGSSRTLFAFLAGFSLHITFGAKLHHLNAKNRLLEFLKQFLFSSISMVVFYYLGVQENILNDAMQLAYPVQNKGKHWWQMTNIRSTPLNFFGFINMFQVPVIYVVHEAMLLLKDAKKRSLAKQIVLLLLSQLIFLTTNEVRIAVQRQCDLVFGIKSPFLADYNGAYNAMLNNFPAKDGFQKPLLLYIMQHIAGIFMPLFPFWGHHMSGVAIAEIYLAVKTCNIKMAKTYCVKQMLLHLTINAVCVAPGIGLAYFYFQKGFTQQPPFFFGQLPVVYDPKMEFTSYQPVQNNLIFLLFLCVFEFSPKLQKRVNATLWVRRFSTYSLTFYVFEGVFQMMMKAFFAPTYPKIYEWQTLNNIYITLLMMLVHALLILCVSIVLDQAKGVMSVEWFMSRMFSVFGKEGGEVYLAHQSVKPVQIRNCLE